MQYNNLDKTEIERKCFKRYLKNQNISFKEEEIISNSEENSVIDVSYGPKKYQIRYCDDKNVSERIKMVKNFRKAKEENNKNGMIKNYFKMSKSRGHDEILREVIIKPGEEKINKYLKQARGVTLLICSDLDYSDPIFVKDELENYRKTGQEVFDKSKNLFDEIYLVYPSENIKIYPLLQN